MTPFAIPALMMIGSGSAHAVVNAIVKGRRAGDDADPLQARMTARASTDGASAILLLPATLVVPLPAGAWGWLAASALVHIVYFYAMIRAYATSDFSAAYPVMRGSAPILTAIVSLGLLGERATSAQLAGIAVVSAAILALVAGRHLASGALGWALTTGSMTTPSPTRTASVPRRRSQAISSGISCWSAARASSCLRC